MASMRAVYLILPENPGWKSEASSLFTILKIM